MSPDNKVWWKEAKTNAHATEKRTQATISKSFLALSEILRSRDNTNSPFGQHIVNIAEVTHVVLVAEVDLQPRAGPAAPLLAAAALSRRIFRRLTAFCF